MENQKRILVVDDDTINQLVMKKLLQNEGYDFIIANNGIEAIESYLHFNFDLILMDIYMPVMNGFEASKAIREIEKASRDAHTPIVAISAGYFPDIDQKMIECGINEFVAKPFSKVKLLAVITNLFTVHEFNK